jgi:hypothetical protein
MATEREDSKRKPAAANGAPAPEPRRKVVVVPELVGGIGSLNVVWALLAGLISVAAHALLILLFLFLPMGSANANPAGEVKTETVVEDEQKEKEPDLTNTDIGLDSDVPTNFNVDRIDEVSVPGMVNPTESVGIIGAPEGPARTLPAPPGSGGGTGGAIFDPNQAGTGSMAGSIGGMGGIANLGGFAGRSGATREKMAMEGGGSPLSEACVGKGLLWLARHQAPDGRWSLNEFNRHAREQPFPAGKSFVCNCTGMANRRDDISGTAFALLPYLAAGITHRPPKAKQTWEYHKSVMAGINFILSKQGKDGYYGGGMYAHGLTAIAMCEAYGLTSDPMLKKSAQAACNYIVAAQDAAGGGWRYSPRTPGDTSVTGWQLMALKSGQMAGLSIPYECLKKAERFLDSCESQSKGGYGYVPGSGETPAMTSVALLCRMYLGINPRNPGLLAGIDRLKATPPATGNNYNLYYEYYATQVMHHFGGEPWELWNKGPDGKSGIRDVLIKRMDTGLNPKTNHQEGSWAPMPAGHVTEGGRIMATSLSLLSLEVYYRHLPLYRRDMGVMKNEK